MMKPEIAFAALLATSLLAACVGNRTARGGGPGAGNPSANPEGSQLTDASRVADSEPDVRDLTAQAVPELREVRFAYDSDHLDSAARLVLKANAGYFKTHPAAKTQIAGHCDPRGTVPYNLALGQRRARAIRDYYRLLGVAGARVATISYGSERPACSETTESCWAINRRAETLVMADKNIASSPRREVGLNP
jgi:peptidoglycan-associated lipoprotein